MKDNKLFRPLLIFLIVVLLFGSSATQTALNNDRTKLGLTDNEPLKNAPPVLAFTTVALGGFRGLIANALWIRANDLQLEEKYFETVQLADWITKLQPHFTTVWVFQAWNMAYNISIKFPDKEDRWNWIKSGIELLRDQALRFNPHETLIYRELGWFYQDKIGKNSDDFHMHFKLSWAYEMSQVLGDPPYNFQPLLNPQTDDAKARVKTLTEKYKMDPKIMQEVEDRYGPLDWRTPETMAIYWASAGLKYAKQDDLMPIRRMIYQSMQLAFIRGHLMINNADHQAEFTANVDIVPRVNAAYEEMIAAEPTVGNIKQGHMNFLLQAVQTTYLYNREREAAKWWAYLKRVYPEKVVDWPAMEDYVMFRINEILKNDSSQEKFDTTVRGYLDKYYYFLAIGEEELALGHRNFASKCWQIYQKNISYETRPDILKKLTLSPFAKMEKEELDKLIGGGPGAFTPELAAQLRTRLGLPPPTNMVAQATVSELNKTNVSTNSILSVSLPERNFKEGQAYINANRDKPGVTTLPSGLQYTVIKAGSGRTPTENDILQVNYVGTTISGKEFDSSIKRGKPFQCQLNKDIIQGWSEALALMKEGAKWRVVIPANLAYGVLGHPPAIGPNETLIFEMEMVSIQKPTPPAEAPKNN